MAEVTIKIIARAAQAGAEVKQFSDKASRGLKDVEARSKGAAVGMGAASKQTITLKTAMMGLKTVLVGVGVALAGMVAYRGFAALKDFMTNASAAAMEDEKSFRSMEQVMRSMGRYSPELMDQLKVITREMLNLAAADDTATNDALKFLGTYGQITNDVLPRALKLTMDLANGWNMNLQSAANMVGKAAMGLTGELRRVGITISDDVAKSKDFIKIMGEMEDQVGGQAEVFRKTAEGTKKYYTEALGEVQEVFGYVLNDVLQPLHEALGRTLIGEADFLAKLHDEGKLRIDISEEFQNRMIDTAEAIATGLAIVANQFVNIEASSLRVERRWLSIKEVVSGLHTLIANLMANIVDGAAQLIKAGIAIREFFGADVPESLTKMAESLTGMATSLYEQADEAAQAGLEARSRADEITQRLGEITTVDLREDVKAFFSEFRRHLADVKKEQEEAAAAAAAAAERAAEAQDPAPVEKMAKSLQGVYEYTERTAESGQTILDFLEGSVTMSDELAEKIGEGRGNFVQMVATAKEAEKVDIDLGINELNDELDAAKKKLDELIAKKRAYTKTGGGEVVTAEGMQHGGPVEGIAGGPPVLKALHPKEYVINPRATAFWGQSMLDSINQMKVPPTQDTINLRFGVRDRDFQTTAGPSGVVRELAEALAREALVGGI